MKNGWLRKFIIHSLCVMTVASSIPFMSIGKVEAAQSNQIPSLNVYQKNNHVKAEWGIDILDTDVLIKTGFESGEEVPNLRGGEGPSEGGQSISSEDPYQGSKSIRIHDTIVNGNAWWYPSTSSEFSRMYFARKYGLTNGMKLSVTLKAKAVGGDATITPIMDGGPGKIARPLHEIYPATITKPVKFINPVKPGDLTYQVDNVEELYKQWSVYGLHLSRNKATNYDVQVGYIKHIDVSSKTVTMHERMPLNDYYKAGDDLLGSYWMGMGFNQRVVKSDTGWNTYSFNDTIPDGLDFDVSKMGLLPLIDTRAPGTLYIDDVKFGFATEVELYRDKKPVYRGYLSDFEDMDAIDKAPPSPVSNVNIKIGSDRKPTITWDPSYESGTLYSYSIKGISRNGETPISAEYPVKITSGLKGYAVVVDQNPITVPTAVNVNGTNITVDPQNGNFYVHIATIDNQGNTSTIVHVPYIDQTSPQLNVSADHTHSSQGPVTLTATASDFETGLKHIELPDGRKIASGTAQYVATSNGTYTFRAEDNAGNVTERSMQVGNIDQEAPVIIVTPVERPWGSTDIAAEIRYTDAQSGIDPNSRKYTVSDSSIAPTQWKVATSDLQHLTISDEGQWYVHAKAADLAGNTQQVTTQVLQLQHLPSTPDFRVTSVETDRVSLEWTLPAGGVLTSGYEYEIENTTTGRSWKVAYPQHSLLDQDVEPGKVYQYRLLAKNHVGSSAYTAPVTALTLPAAVQNLAVYPVDRGAAIASVKFDPAESADEYHIAVTENASKQLVYESTVTTATYQPIQNLQPGVNYTIQVTPENGSGRGAASSVGFLSLPAAPGQFSAIQINTDGIRLGWTSVTSATYYELQRDRETIYGGPKLTYKDTGLESGTEYGYEIAAKNDTGHGESSKLTNIITLPARTTVTAATYGTDRITLQWPSVKGAADYVIGVDGQEVGTVAAATYGTLQTYEITGLHPGVSYRFSLQPENRSGSGEETYVVASTIPEAVGQGSIKITDILETSAALQWEAVPGATTYRVRIAEQVYEISDTTLKLNGLQGGKRYDGILEAGNGSGYGSGTTISILTLPPQVGEIKAEEKGNELQLMWEPIPSATKYMIEQDGQEVAVVSESSWKAEDLSAGETYHFSVRAVNETGEGAKTPFIWRMLPDGVDELKVQVSDISEHSAKLSWEAAHGADGYRVYEGEKKLLQVTEPSVVLEGLESAKVYKNFMVVPFNSTGEAPGVRVPAFATFPSGDVHVKAEARKDEIVYQFELVSKNETIVVMKDGKEVYRGKDREFVLRPLPSGTNVKVEVWTENDYGERSKGQIVQVRTLEDEKGSTSGGSSGGHTNGNQTDKKQEELPKPEVVEEDKKEDTRNEIFYDIEGLYNKDQVLALYEQGILMANGERKFEPKRTITRAEFTAMIVRAARLEGKEAAPMLFKDIDPKGWYYRELRIAHANGVINGFNKTEFRPNESITREQASKMLGNILSSNKKPMSILFRDKDSISKWATNSVRDLNALQIIQGYEDGTFRPKLSVNRAEGVAFIFKFLHAN